MRWRIWAKPPVVKQTDWRNTGQYRWRVLSVCNGYRLVRRQEMWIDFVACETEWRDTPNPMRYWESALYDEQTRSPVQSAHDEVTV